MRKLLCRIMILCAFVFALIGTAYAEELSTNFLSSDGTLTINGEIGNAEGKAVLAVITKKQKESIKPEELTAAEYTAADNIAIYTARTSANGELNISIKLPEFSENGKYYVYLISDDAEEQSYFMYINYNNIKELLSYVNEAASADDIYKLLEAPENSFAIDKEKLQDYLKEISKVFYEIKTDKTYTDVQKMINDYKTAEAIGQLRCGVDGNTVLKMYNSYFDAEYDEFSKLSETVRAEILSILTKSSYAKDSAAEIYRRAVVYARVAKADSWDELKNAMIEYDSELDLDKDYFNSIVNRDDVYDNMYKNRSEIKDYSCIKKVFYTVSKMVYENENKKSSNNTGSISGGGGYRGGATNISVSNEIKQEIDNKDNDRSALTDISDHWAEEYITALVKLGVVSGFEDGSFHPDNLVTRAEFVKLMTGALNLKGGADSRFADVPADSWYCSYVNAAFAAGLITGDVSGMFRPEDNITRQETAAIIYRALGDKLEVRTEKTDFTDYTAIEDYARKSVGILGAADIISGMPDGSFAPKANTTRAEAAALIYRAVYK